MTREFVLDIIDTCIEEGVTVPLYIIARANELGIILDELEAN